MVSFTKRKGSAAPNPRPTVAVAPAEPERTRVAWQHPKKISAQTPAVNVSAAVPAVINTVELLEQILLRLDMKTLLLAQRVSRNWDFVIKDSRKLQQKLFLLPATQKEIAGLHIIEGRKYFDIDQEDLVKTQNTWSTGEDSVKRICGHLTLKSRETFIYNPLLLRQHPIKRGGPALLQLFRLPKQDLKPHHSAAHSPKPALLLSPPPTTAQRPTGKKTSSPHNWDRMLLVQPSSVFVGIDLCQDPRADLLLPSKLRCGFRGTVIFGEFLGGAAEQLSRYRIAETMRLGRICIARSFSRGNLREGKTNATIIGRPAGEGEIAELFEGGGMLEGVEDVAVLKEMR